LNCGRDERLLSRLDFSLHFSTAVLLVTVGLFSRFGPNNLNVSTTRIRYPARLDVAVAGIGVFVDKLAPIFSWSSP
jgi:hypothetical protein